LDILLDVRDVEFFSFSFIDTNPVIQSIDLYLELQFALHTMDDMEAFLLREWFLS
jgi:hypothetical protein